MQPHRSASTTPTALAINGGPKTRTAPMPPRFSVGPGEEKMLAEMMAYYRERGLDPGYDGVFEKKYCDAMVAYMGAGYADAVSSGTAAVYIALQALELPAGSEVLVPPVTDGGCISPVIVSGHVPRLCDSKPRHYNVGVEQVISRFTPRTKAVVLVHLGGQPIADIAEIVAEAHRRNIRVLEDCSQCTGGEVNGVKIGGFGDIAVWSTGSRKNLTSGANGGMVYTKDRDLMRKAVAYADRGKPKLDPTYEERNPNTYVMAALNLNAEEFGCAMGIASLARLDETRARRLAFVRALDERIAAQSKCCVPYGWTEGDSTFFQPVILDATKTNVEKRVFADALAAEGIPLNPHYAFMCADWGWLKPHLTDDFDTPNARWIRDNSFNIFVNENYTVAEAEDTIAAITKIEHHYAKA